eukprot:2740063-Rhodomonas_salina.2
MMKAPMRRGRQRKLAEALPSPVAVAEESHRGARPSWPRRRAGEQRCATLRVQSRTEGRDWRSQRKSRSRAQCSHVKGRGRGET